MAELKNTNKKNLLKEQQPPNVNPCHKEQEMSYDCLNRNSYDAAKCVVHFENYKTCKAFWNTIRLERMRKGIEPLIPSEEERKRIIAERFPGKKSL